MKVPRDIDADNLINTLMRHGYIVIRQTGSHIRLSKKLDNDEHNITVPNHKPVKIGTLQSIATQVCKRNNIDIRDFYQELK